MELTSHISPLAEPPHTAPTRTASTPREGGPRSRPEPPAQGFTKTAPTRPLVHAVDLTRSWGKGASAQLGVDRVTLSVGSGELVSIVGPSGSGKSTLGALIVDKL